jgi:hypothetical protein
MNEPPSGQKSIGRRLSRSPVLWVFLVTLFALAIYPIAFCIDCEGPNPWGQKHLPPPYAFSILALWMVAASITAGYCSARKYWLVPASIVLAQLITQPVGGVAPWSLWSNEGPVIVLLGFVAGAVGLTVGAVTRFFVDRLVRATP